MNKTLWKLDKFGDRLWIVAMDTAQQAATLGEYGRGLAVVADETRRLAVKIENATERALFEDEEIEEGPLINLANELTFLALNCAIEASRLGARGKAAAVCSEEIRNLAFTLDHLFLKTERIRYRPHPAPCVTTVARPQEFISFMIGTIILSENISNVQEVLGPAVERTDTHIKFREQSVRLVDPFRLMGAEKKNPSYVILKTPWAEQNKTYAVAVDNVIGLYFSPTGKPAAAPSGMPLADYVRECWDTEDGEPVYFMDWPRMA